MISRRPRAFALSFVATIVLAACSSSPGTGATVTGTGGSAGTTSSSTSAGGNGGVGGSSADTSSATSTSATASAASSTSTSAVTSTSAASGSTSSGGTASCAADTDAELAMETMGLLYPSESDYPFDTVDLKDPQGSGAITPAHLLALLAMDPQLKTETRTVDMFFANLLAGPDGPQYQIVLDTLQNKLTNLAVIRIIPAPPSSAQVHVYVVGRTFCGEVAGITTLSIET